MKRQFANVGRAVIPALTVALAVQSAGAVPIAGSENVKDMLPIVYGAVDSASTGNFIPFRTDGDAKVVSHEVKVTDFADYKTNIQGKWSESYITTLVNKGGIKGYEDGTFRPKANITTAELVSILLGTSGAEVDTTNWPDSIMAQANKAGILDSSMLTEGNVPISREKMAYVLVNSASKLLGEQVTSDKYAPDSIIPDLASASSEYRDEIKAAYGLGLLAGNDDAGTFKPSAPTTREETCVIINRLFKYTDRVDNLHKPTPKPEVKPPVTGDVPHWSIEDFEFGNDESEKYRDPNRYIGDMTGAIYPREGEIGPNGKQITRDPVTGVLGFGNGQKGGIYLNRTYVDNSAGTAVPFELKVGSLTPETESEEWMVNIKSVVIMFIGN